MIHGIRKKLETNEIFYCLRECVCVIVRGMGVYGVCGCGMFVLMNVFVSLVVGVIADLQIGLY